MRTAPVRKRTERPNGQGSSAFGGGDRSLGSPAAGSDFSKVKCLNWTHVFLRTVVGLTPLPPCPPRT